MKVQQKRATCLSDGNVLTKKNRTLCWQWFAASTDVFTKHSQECSNRSSLRGKRKTSDWPSDGVKALEGVVVVQEVTTWELETMPPLPSGLAWDYSVFTSLEQLTYLHWGRLRAHIRAATGVTLCSWSDCDYAVYLVLAMCIMSLL